MGRSVDLKVYDRAKLVEAIEAHLASKLPDRDGETEKKHSTLVVAILDECGHSLGDRYILLNNEMWDEGNPYYEVSSLIERAVGYPRDDGLDDVFDCFLDSGSKYSESGVSYVDTCDIAERLGLPPREED